MLESCRFNPVMLAIALACLAGCDGCVPELEPPGPWPAPLPGHDVPPERGQPHHQPIVQLGVDFAFRGGEEGEAVRVTLTCGDHPPFVESAEFADRGAAAPVADIYVPDVPVGMCTVEICILGPDGEPDPACECSVHEVEITPEREAQVYDDQLCISREAPIDVRVSRTDVDMRAPEFLPGHDLAACGGFLDVHFPIILPPDPWFETRLRLEVTDAELAERLRFDSLGGRTFRIVALEPGPGGPPAVDGHIPVRLFVDFEAPRFDFHRQVTYDFAVYAHATDGQPCACADGRPLPVAAEHHPDGTGPRPDCRVVDDVLTLIGPQQPDDTWYGCQAPLDALYDISGLVEPGAPPTRVAVKVCADAGGPAEQVWVLLESMPGGEDPSRSERVAVDVLVEPGSCTTRMIDLHDLLIDPQSNGRVHLRSIDHLHLVRLGGPDLRTFTVETATGCCEGRFSPAFECCNERGVDHELCNAHDDDCDGHADEGFGVGDACAAGVGACRRDGQRVCTAEGDAACDAVPGLPDVEACNAADDDCDGQIDEGYGLGEPCRVGVGACRRDGEQVCGADGATACSAEPGQARAEVCNDLDDDCDGTVDELVRNRCGECGAERAERCGGGDDDCDGRVDEGLERRRLEFFHSGGACCDSHDDEKISEGEQAEGREFTVREGQRVDVVINYAVDGHVGCIDCPDNWRCDDPMPQGDERLTVILENVETGRQRVLGSTRDVNGEGGDWDDRSQRCIEGRSDWAPNPGPGRYRIIVRGEGGSVILKTSHVVVRCG